VRENPSRLERPVLPLRVLRATVSASSVPPEPVLLRSPAADGVALPDHHSSDADALLEVSLNLLARRAQPLEVAVAHLEHAPGMRGAFLHALAGVVTLQAVVVALRARVEAPLEPSDAQELGSGLPSSALASEERLVDGRLRDDVGGRLVGVLPGRVRLLVEHHPEDPSGEDGVFRHPDVLAEPVSEH